MFAYGSHCDSGPYDIIMTADMNFHVCAVCCSACCSAGIIIAIGRRVIDKQRRKGMSRPPPSSYRPRRVWGEHRSGAGDR